MGQVFSNGGPFTNSETELNRAFTYCVLCVEKPLAYKSKSLNFPRDSCPNFHFSCSNCNQYTFSLYESNQPNQGVNEVKY